MLQKEPLNRISAERILASKWFENTKKESQSANQNIQLSSDVIMNMMKYKGASKLKRAAMNLLVKQVNPMQLKDLHDQFRALDIDQSGWLHASEIMEAIKKQGLDF